MKPSAFICGLFINLLAFGQQPLTTNSIDVTTTKPTEWSTYVDHQNLKIEYKFVNCNPSIGYDKEMLLLRFKNKLSQAMTVSWHSKQFYGGVCKTCDSPEEYGFSIDLESQESEEGSCELDAAIELKIFSKFTDINYHGDPTSLTSFLLDELIVSTIQNN